LSDFIALDRKTPSFKFMSVINLFSLFYHLLLILSLELILFTLPERIAELNTIADSYETRFGRNLIEIERRQIYICEANKRLATLLESTEVNWHNLYIDVERGSNRWVG